MSRPTKYKTEYCDLLVEHMKQGGSIDEFCLEVDVCIQTLYNWFEAYPEFLESKKKGESFSRGWWLKNGRLQLENKDFNYTGWYMNMKNRFGWSDKQSINQKNTNIYEPDLSKLSDDELRKLAEIQSKSGVSA